MSTRQIAYDLVVARTLSGGIGRNGKLPWILPSDLKMFKKITSSSPHGNAVILGRRTFQSINNRPLPDRLNIIVSNSSKIEEKPNLRQAGSFKEALQLFANEMPKGKAFVIGGSKIYEEALPECRYVYETRLADSVQCDTFVPSYDHLSCSYISKTFCEKSLRFDYRLYYNQALYGPPAENLFAEPEHEEYQYLRAIRKIIEEGESRTDRTGTGTRALFGGTMRYDLSTTFPLLTHKKVFWKGVVEELLWFIRGCTDNKQLESKGVNIWAGNSSEEYLRSIGIQRKAGDLGPIYGFQWRHWNALYGDCETDYRGRGIDQLAWLIEEIKRNPSSRRLILTAWNPEQLGEMALPPCHILCQFQVTASGRLNCIMYQRSCDMGLGVPFNIASYSLLTCMIAQVCGLKRGEFIHMLGDMHVYNDHVQQLQGVDQLRPFAFPSLQIDSSVTDIDDFRPEHFQLKGYQSHKKIPMKMSV